VGVRSISQHTASWGSDGRSSGLKVPEVDHRASPPRQLGCAPCGQPRSASARQNKTSPFSSASFQAPNMAAKGLFQPSADCCGHPPPLPAQNTHNQPHAHSYGNAHSHSVSTQTYRMTINGITVRALNRPSKRYISGSTNLSFGPPHSHPPISLHHSPISYISYPIFISYIHFLYFIDSLSLLHALHSLLKLFINI